MKKEDTTKDTSVLYTENIEKLAQQKYLDYAMSVITSRALPDVRDGLKPVQRRILYAMHSLKITSNGAYKKSARIVGDTIGKYHPHGDSSVYEAMVRLAQPFSMRMLLVDGQGNFGSVDGDSPAAMRYTEARFHKFSESMFDDIHLNTVDMRENYDGSELEPSVLPVKIPNLLINGVQGIAVGMASNIPPHNPIEVMNAVKYMVECKKNNQEIDVDELVKLVPAPDFPTKGLIHGTASMKEAWLTGNARMKIRAKWKEEIIDGRTVIVIHELPYQVNKERLKEKIMELASPITNKTHPRYGKVEVEGIYEVLDESDKNGTRLAIYLKQGVQPDLLFNQLLGLTQLEESINYNATVIVNGEPKLLGLKDILENFIEHRNEVIYRRTQTLYEKNLAREIILEGLMKAVNPKNLDNVIQIIKASKEVKEAREKLMELLEINENQSNAILELNLKRLTGLEIENMQNELEQRRLENIEYRKILNDQIRRYEIILEESNEKIEEFLNTKEDFDKYWNIKPYAQRLSDYQPFFIETNKGSLIKEEDCVILYSHNGYIRRASLEDLKEQNRGTQGNKKFQLKPGDYIVNTIDTFSHDLIMFITEKAQAFTIPAYEIETNINGYHINNVLHNKLEDDKIAKILPVNFEENQDITIISKNGMVKRSRLQEYQKSTVYKAGMRLMKLQEEDIVFDAHITSAKDDLMFFKSDNTVSRTNIENFSIKKGRVTSGVMGTKLTSELIGVVKVKETEESGIIATISENGLLKLSYADEYRQTSRKSKGVKAFKESDRSGTLVKATYIDNLHHDILIVTQKGIINRVHLANFKVSSRISTGVKLIELMRDDKIVSSFVVEHEED
jgi:DNA gyrase subunit A